MQSLAERVGFEPTVLLLVQRFSRPPRSTTPAPLRMCGLGVRGGVYRDERQIARGKSQISPNSFAWAFGARCLNRFASLASSLKSAALACDPGRRKRSLCG